MRFVCYIWILFLLVGCRKSETPNPNEVVLPVCDFGGLDLEPLTKLSSETGLVVQQTLFRDQGDRVRVKLEGSNSYLDPCNLPEGVAIGSEILFSATWYKVKNSDHLNLDYFPIKFSKLEILDPAVNKPDNDSP